MNVFHNELFAFGHMTPKFNVMTVVFRNYSILNIRRVYDSSDLRNLCSAIFDHSKNIAVLTPPS
jgi:hypothetical protein